MSNWNQLHENTFCNSEAYNNIYRKNIIRSRLYSLRAWCINSHIQSNLPVLSKMLEIRTGNSGIQYTKLGEINRRSLQITADIIYRKDPKNLVNPEYITFAVIYTYEFDFYSPTYKYKFNEPETINNNKCRCVDDSNSQNHLYTFQVSPINLFHFSFHIPNNNNKKYKFRGAFHLWVDYLQENGVVPYRPFIIDPRQTAMPHQFVLWDNINTILKDFFTTSNTSIDLSEIAPFLLKHPGKVVDYTTSRGRTVNFIDTILKPIYDKIVVDILNPLLAASTITIQVPVAVQYDPSNTAIVTCNEMTLARQNPGIQRVQTFNNIPRVVMFGGEGRATRKVGRRSKTRGTRRHKR